MVVHAYNPSYLALSSIPITEKKKAQAFWGNKGGTKWANNYFRMNPGLKHYKKLKIKLIKALNTGHSSTRL
jgi:hypothetical protein